MSLSEILSDEDISVINKAQSIRQKIVDRLTEGDIIPTDKNDRDFLLETLKDSDKSIFTKSRLRIANKSAENDRSANAMIAELLAKHTVGSVFRQTEIPELSPDVKPDFIADGEKEIGSNNMSYDQFVK